MTNYKLFFSINLRILLNDDEIFRYDSCDANKSHIFARISFMTILNEQIPDYSLNPSNDTLYSPRKTKVKM